MGLRHVGELFIFVTDTPDIITFYYVMAISKFIIIYKHLVALVRGEFESGFEVNHLISRLGLFA